MRDLVIDVAETAEGAFAVDLRQSIVAWNAAAEELLGYGEEEVLGQKCGSVMGICGMQNPDCSSPRCNAISNTIRGRLTPHVEVAVRARSGDLRWLSMTIIAAHSTSGDLQLVHLFHDISDYHRQTSPDEHDSGVARLPLQLTHREHEVLRLLAAGLTTKDISTTLSISPITVRNHVTRIIEKLDVKTRLQAVVAASRFGLI
jgi:PAS domain S-box-containing protein